MLPQAMLRLDRVLQTPISSVKTLVAVDVV